MRFLADMIENTFILIGKLVAIIVLLVLAIVVLVLGMKGSL